jgi:hypothetical protein
MVQRLLVGMVRPLATENNANNAHIEFISYKWLNWCFPLNSTETGIRRRAISISYGSLLTVKVSNLLLCLTIQYLLSKYHECPKTSQPRVFVVKAVPPLTCEFEVSVPEISRKLNHRRPTSTSRKSQQENAAHRPHWKLPEQSGRTSMGRAESE